MDSQLIMKNKNIDNKTVEGFGDEWLRFDQSKLSFAEKEKLFHSYFSIFPLDKLNCDMVGFDMGCGSGRWAELIAPRVGQLHCIDPSSAIEVAKKNLRLFKNCLYHSAGVGEVNINHNSMDFGYSLGVLHHVPDTAGGIAECVKYLKHGAPFLLYLYYAFDNRPAWYRGIWALSNILRCSISRMPFPMRYWTSQLIALLVYLPLARTSSFLEAIGVKSSFIDLIPLSAYRNASLYCMRTDALDRFGTRLEKRFTKIQIEEMMLRAGLVNINFSNDLPFWCAVGYKK